MKNDNDHALNTAVRSTVGLERTHMPKGGMCSTCEKLNTNCSKLEFENMPVIRTTGNGTRIVKCTEHMRSNSVGKGLAPLNFDRETSMEPTAEQSKTDEGQSRLTVGLGTCTVAGANTEPMNIQKLEQMLETMRGIPPANWILMAPDGRVWKGSDPMVLAAQATWKPAFGNIAA